jgi:hypothetical protein
MNVTITSTALNGSGKLTVKGTSDVHVTKVTLTKDGQIFGPPPNPAITQGDDGGPFTITYSSLPNGSKYTVMVTAETGRAETEPVPFPS